MKNIEILLNEWGAWKRGENRSALGYPGEVAFSRMRVDGQRSADPAAFIVDDDVRQIDDEINRIHPDYKAIVVAHYIASGPVKVKSHRLNVSTRIYYTTLEHAHRCLAYQMGGKYLTGYESKLCAHIARVCAQI